MLSLIYELRWIETGTPAAPTVHFRSAVVEAPTPEAAAERINGNLPGQWQRETAHTRTGEALSCTIPGVAGRVVVEALPLVEAR